MVSPFYNLLRDGMSSRIHLVSSGVTFFEKSVTPPGMEAGGEAIDVTTDKDARHVSALGFYNTKYNFSSFAPRYMTKNTQASATVVYDPALYAQISSQVNVNQEIIVTFPNIIESVDSIQLSFQGWLKSFSPGSISIDEQPEAEVTFVVSNWKIPTSSSQDISTLISPPATF